MKKYIKKSLAIITCLILIFSTAYNVYADTGSTVDVSIDINWVWVSIFAPGTLDFGSWTISSSESSLEIDLVTYSSGSLYFAVEDLKWAASWYIVSFKVNDNITTSWGLSTIPAANMRVTMNWGNSIITVLDSNEWTWWTVPNEVIIPDALNIDLEPLNETVNIIQRTEPTSPVPWVVWKYWVQPKFTMIIPWYQAVWNYSVVLTMDLIAF